jgi:lipopolysaccharide/colanic/teichoic acid biosynthesis glycosyltransferase
MSSTLRSNAHWSTRSNRSSSTLQRSPGALRARAYDRTSTTADVACRALNVVVALIGILITVPLMVIVAVLVRLDSKGPVIYQQQRVGLDRRGSRGLNRRERRRAENFGGRVFTIYKFRTMTVAQTVRSGGRPGTMPGSRDLAASCVRHASTNCPSCSTCSEVT